MLRLTLKKRIGRVLTRLLRLLFRLLQPLGIHIVRNHFYEPVPDTRKLGDETWTNPSDLAGLDMNESGQLEILDEVLPAFVGECDFPTEPTGNSWGFHLANGFFEALDAEVLYCLIRHFKPGRIVALAPMLAPCRTTVRETSSGYSLLRG